MLSRNKTPVFEAINTATVGVFVLDYFLRLLTADLKIGKFGRRKNGEAMALEITEKALERIEAAARIPPPGVEKVCGTCRRHDEWTGACTNALSPNRADFTDEEDACEAWEYDGK